MKQLFYNGNATTMFFKKEDSIDRIITWIMFRVNESDNPFNLNEAHSVKVEKYDENTINIIGDEDYVILDLEEIKPINTEWIYNG